MELSTVMSCGHNNMVYKLHLMAYLNVSGVQLARWSERTFAGLPLLENEFELTISA
jgi:hypothetical protein